MRIRFLRPFTRVPVRKDGYMTNIYDFTPDMQSGVCELLSECLSAAGIEFEPQGRHSAVCDIQKNYMRRGACKCLFHEGKLVGTIALRPLRGDVCEMKLFYVHPEMRARGFGTMLLEEIQREAVRRGYKYMRLDTLRRHQDACRLYKKHGFYDIGRYNENIYAEIFMEKNLTEDVGNGR